MAKGGPNKRTAKEAELTEHHVVELIGAAVREIEEKLTKTMESMISGLDEKITEKVRVHEGDSQPRRGGADKELDCGGYQSRSSLHCTCECQQGVPL